MRKKILLITTVALMSLSLTGCGLVKVIPMGQEGQYTGEEKFDSGAQSSEDWTKVTEEITQTAKDIQELISGDGIKDAAAVSGSGEIMEFNTDTPKYYLLIKLDGTDTEVKVQAGGVYSGTAIRDIQTVKAFENFTNQTEWSQYGKALNAEVDAQVIAPLALDSSAVGKTAVFTGAALQSGNTITITPVTLTIQ